ncbi:MAG: hypothetical protein ACOCV8_04830, partial [Spirochaetota bacterium]
MLYCSGREIKEKKEEEITLRTLIGKNEVESGTLTELSKKEINLLYSFSDYSGIRKPLFINKSLSGEVILFTSKEYYALLHNAFINGKISYEEYLLKIREQYLEKSKKLHSYSFILKIHNIDKEYTDPDNIKLRLTINNNEYKEFGLSNEYTETYLPDNQTEENLSQKDLYYKLETNFNINKLPLESQPVIIPSLITINSMKLELSFKSKKQTYSIVWNNSDFYNFNEFHKEDTKNIKGNEVKFKNTEKPINIGIDEVYINMKLDDFPYVIPRIEEGLFNANLYSIGKYLDNKEYIEKKNIHSILLGLTQKENKHIKENLFSIAKETPFSIKNDILGNYHLIFDNYIIERILIPTPSNSDLKTIYKVKSLGLIINNKNEIVAISF